MMQWNRPAMIVLSLFIWASVGYAQETVETWGEVLHTTAHHVLSVGNAKGHTIGVMEQQGLALFDGDDVATLTIKWTYEQKADQLTFKGYALYTFADGATRTATVAGNGSRPGKQEGSLIFTQGSGRFSGIAGKGRWTAVTFATDSHDTHVEVTASHTCIREC